MKGAVKVYDDIISEESEYLLESNSIDKQIKQYCIKMCSNLVKDRIIKQKEV